MIYERLQTHDFTPFSLLASRFSLLASRFSLLADTRHLGALALLGLATLPQAVQAQTIVYNNGNYGNNAATPISGYTVADDFIVIAPLNVDMIRVYLVDLAPGLVTNFSGNLTWFIYSGTNGVPSPNAMPSTNIIAQGTVSPTITNTGSILSFDPNVEIAQCDFAIPLQTLSAGTYWLRLKEGTETSNYDGTDTFWVATGAAITGNGHRISPGPPLPLNWNDNSTNTRDISFQLLSSGSSAPEPGTLALLALGIVGGVVARRRK